VNYLLVFPVTLPHSRNIVTLLFFPFPPSKITILYAS